MTPCAAAVEQWARAICKAFGSDPDAVIGNPPNPRWLSFAGYARLAIEAKALIEAGA